MIEREAQCWIERRFGTDAVASLSVLVDMIRSEAAEQNLISASTLDTIWIRHILDSAQLVPLVAGAASGVWLDVGTGAGFPGMVTAILSDRRTILVEPRARRVAFLNRVIDALGFTGRVSVVPSKVEAVNMEAAVISARAVAKIDQVLSWAMCCSTADTWWVLPKGRSAHEEVTRAQRSWHGMFHVEQSITDSRSLIVMAHGVSRR